MRDALLSAPSDKLFPEYHWLLANNLLSDGSVLNDMIANGVMGYSDINGKSAISMNLQRGLVTDKEIIIGNNGWTYSAEVRLNSFGSYGHLFTATTGQDSFALKIATNASGLSGGAVYFYTSTTGSKISKLILPLNRLAKLQVVYSPGVMKFYLDYVLVDTINFTIPVTIMSASRKYSVGRYQTQGLNEGGDFNLRDFSFLKRALTETELKKL